jgi:hypothetical protein
MDLFLSKIISQFRLIMRKTSEFVIQAFKSADLDGNKMCNLKEFLMLYRHIEAGKFKENEAMELFEVQADLVSEDERNMSFDRFTAICVDYGLFSEAQQNKFLGISSEADLTNKFQELRHNWIVKKAEIQKNLDLVKDYIEEEEFSNWEKIRDVLEKRVQKQDEIDKKPLLIAFKIMNQELIRMHENKQDIKTKAVNNKGNDLEDEELVDEQEEFLDEEGLIPEEDASKLPSIVETDDYN